MNIGVVLAGGTGVRYGGNVPKQYLLLNNKEVLYYAINALKNSGVIDKILVACDKDYQSGIVEKYSVDVCDGGNNRNITVKNAIDFIKANYPKCKKVIFVDSARPLLRGNNVKDCIDALDEFDCTITGQKITDSLGSYKMRYLNREDFYLVQTPEAFRFDVISECFNVENTHLTAIYQHLDETASLNVYFGQKNNMKITYKGDIEYIEKVFSDILEN
ncbi:MAG: 2-C-methyl-D-erythritol 4-phosphate cytidylyltransferase [Christensenellales bacterium]